MSNSKIDLVQVVKGLIALALIPRFNGSTTFEELCEGETFLVTLSKENITLSQDLQRKCSYPGFYTSMKGFFTVA